MPNHDTQPQSLIEAKLANELARRLIAGHRPDWRPNRDVPSAVRPIERALTDGSLTPDQARKLLAEVWQEVSGRRLPIDAGSDELFTELARSISQRREPRVAVEPPDRRGIAYGA